MANRGKHWPNLHHVVGPASDLPPWLEAATSDDRTKVEPAIARLHSLLVGHRAWCSAAPRAVTELLAAAFHPETAFPALLLGVVAEVCMAGAWRKPQWDALGEEVRDAVTERAEDLAVFFSHSEPEARASAVIIAWACDLDLPNGPDADPLVDATLAIARARRGLPVWAGPLGNTLASLSTTPEVIAVATVLGDGPLDGSRFRWCRGRIEEVVYNALPDSPPIAATILAKGFAMHPTHADRHIWARFAGSLGFQGNEPAALSEAQRDILVTCFNAPYERNALEVAWVPASREDGRRWLELDPPGPWEAKVDSKPLYLVMEGFTEHLDVWLGLPVSDEHRLFLAGDTAFRPYWLEPVSLGILTVLAGRADSLAWAKQFIQALPTRSVGLDEDPEAWHHVQFARSVLARHEVELTPSPAPASQPSAPARVPAIPAVQPESAPPPPTPVANTPAIEVVLELLTALLSMPDPSRSVQNTVAQSVAWADAHHGAHMAGWREHLSDAAKRRLQNATE